jgi:putative sugar O-methyltransferase
MRIQLLIDSVYRYRLLERLVPGITPSDLKIEDFGNPYGMYVGNEFVRTSVDYQYYYAKKVAELLENDKRRSTVVELGGGIGGFAYFLNKLRSANLTYINFDLPEILCISSYQLLNLFPEKSFLLYGETARLDSDVILASDIALLPSFAVELLGADSVDVAFNSYSLAEMDLETIQNYSSQLSRISRRNIFHVNHVANALVGADSFSFDSKKFELVSRTRALWNLGRNLNCDEYEFLFKRRPT